MRLIDADKLIPTTLTDGGYWTKEVFFRKDIDNAPTVTPGSPQWISVKDRLPECDGSYIVYSALSGKVYTAHYYERHRHWSGRAADKFISHWMPLPEPPEVESKPGCKSCMG